MTRPQTAQDVFDAQRRDRLVEPARLSAFLDRHNPLDAPSALDRLVADGLLTAYQASEVAGGRGERLWLGGYKVLDRLGKGGMGHVYLAEHSVLGRLVAVKALSDALRADPGARRRFVREACAAAALDHPNIVHVFDVNMLHDPPYLVMEYVDGVSLQAAVARTGTFSVGEAAAVGVQVADGLARATVVGLVHRDIKPANLLVDRHGAVKILDLGIVRFTHDDTHSRIQGREVILGTLDYLAPEQAEDSSNVDARADIYSLGATLYFLLAGHPPFPVADVRRKLEAKQTEDPPLVHVLRPDVSAEFSAVVQRLMARDPAERPPSPAAVIAALHAWAVPGPDFPARLFRLSSDSTAHGRRLTDHAPGHDPMPDTLRITKPKRAESEPADDAAPSGGVCYRAFGPPTHPSNEIGADPATDAATDAGCPVLPATDEIIDEHAADTDGGNAGAALTDDAMAVPPELLEEMELHELLAPPVPAPEPPEPRPEDETSVHPVIRPRTRFQARTVIGLLLAVLGVLAGGAALVLFAGR